MYVFVTLWDSNMKSDGILDTAGLECLQHSTIHVSSLDCDKSLLDLAIYVVLTWLLPMGVKGYSLTKL